MSEEDLLEAVIQLARVLGWRVAHFRPARTDRGWVTPVQGDGKGFPDLVLARYRDPRVLVVELKSTRGTLTVDQVHWLEHLAQSLGTDSVLVWRPADWASGEIERELRR